MSEKNLKKRNQKVLVIGELHQDLFYVNNAYSNLADELTKHISKNYDIVQKEPDTLHSNLRKIIIQTMNRTSKKYASETYIKRGGNGNNSATLLAKIGIPTGILTVVGTGSEWMFPEIEKLGIDTSTIFKKNFPTPISTIVEDPEITKIFIAKNLKENMNFEGVELPSDLFKDALITFITPMDFKYKHLLEVSVHSEIITAFTLELQKIDNFKTLTECVKIQPDIMFCNLDDGVKICKTSEGLAISVEETDEPIEKLVKVDESLKKFAKIRIYTLGKHGSWIRFADKTIHQKVFSVEVKNRTGAGDAFAAGFIAKLFESIRDVEDYRKKTDNEKEWMFKVCLVFASAAGALKVSSGIAPNRERIIQFLEINQK